MLVYLDALIAALTVRDVAEVERLLAHPLGRLLSDEVRAEARGITEGTRDTLAAPLRAMQMRYRTAELLRDAPLADGPELPAAAEPIEPPRAPLTPPQLTRRNARQQQMELPLSA